MAAFIMAGPLQALGFILLFALLSSFLPLMSLLSNAAVALITLRFGWKRGFSLAFLASLVLAGLGFALQGNLLASFALSFLWLPVIGLAVLLERGISWSRLLRILFIAVSVLIGLFHLNVSDPVAFWQEFISLSDNETQLLREQFPETDTEALIKQASQYFVGAFALGFSLTCILSLMIGRHWQATLYNPGGFRSEFHQLRIGWWPAAVLAIAIGAALLTRSPLATDIVLAGMAVYLFQGLAMVHSLHHGKQMHIGWLIGLYGMLIIVPHLALLVAAFGIIDSFADFRKQLDQQKDN